MKRLLTIPHFPIAWNITDRKPSVFLFKLSVYFSKKHGKYSVILTNIEGTLVKSNILTSQKSYNQCLRWIDKFKKWDYDKQIDFLSKKEIQPYIPSNKKWVVVSTPNDKGRLITQFIPKSLLKRGCDNDLSFDGMDRARTLLGNTVTCDKKIRLRKSRSIVQDQHTFTKRTKLPKNKALRMQDRNKKFQ